MLHIILTILKIIGIILLVIIGLVLLICACILFVPVRYNATITYKDKLVVNAQMTYLLHIVSAKYLREGREGNVSLRIFGFHTHFLDKDKKKKEKKYEEDTRMFEEMSEKLNGFESSAKDNHASGIEDQTVHGEENNKIPVKETKADDVETVEADRCNKNGCSEEDSANGLDNNEDNPGRWNVLGRIKAKLKKTIHNFKEIISKFKYRFKTICGTIKKIYKNIKDFKRFICDERTKMALSFAKGEAVKLIRHIKPKKVKGYLIFGFDDPSYTGKTLGLIYMFSRGTRKNFQIKPDFENKVFETDVHVKGRIQIYYLLIIAYRFYKNKNFREVLERRRTYGREQ